MFNPTTLYVLAKQHDTYCISAVCHSVPSKPLSKYKAITAMVTLAHK